MKKLDRKPFLRSMLLVLLFLCSFCLGGVLSPFGVQDGEAYVWPQDEKFPKEMGYFRSGQVVYTQYREPHADGTGVSQDASILIMMAEEEVPSTVSNEPLPILSNLYITLIDGVVWDT